MKQLLKLNISSKSFGGKQILGGVSLAVQAGEFVSILGKSGCGKTTLLRLILGLDQDYEGEIEMESGTQTGIIFQEHRLLPWLKVDENVGFALNGEVPKDDKRLQIESALELVGLSDYKNTWIRELSGGMKQRLALARALVASPQLLLLDEPFGALDAFTRLEMQRELARIVKQKRTSCIMVTHDVEEAIALSDRIVVLAGNPTNVQKVVPVHLTNKTDRTHVSFIQIRKEILQALQI